MPESKAQALMGPTIFFAASTATLATAPNFDVATGGAGLTAAAMTAIVATATGKNLWSAVPIFCLLANGPLAVNGLKMMSTGETTLVAAGLCLALANGVAYLGANVKGTFNQVTQASHAKASMAAGALITTAGAVLQDPALAIIGLGFTTEAGLRYNPVETPAAAPLPAHIKSYAL